MFDDVASRRNPITKQQEAAVRREIKKFAGKGDPRPDQVYALVIGEIDSPIYFYVGIAKDPHARFKQHLRGISNPLDLKDAYEFIRHHKLKDTLRMEVVDPEGEYTENDWIVLLAENGHPLQNGVGGVDCRRKKRKVKSKADQEKNCLLRGIPVTLPSKTK